MDINIVSNEKEAIYPRVLMVPPMEELCVYVTEWRDILLGKCLDVNAAKCPYERNAGSVMCTGW